MIYDTSEFAADEKEEDNRRGSLDEDYVAHDDDEAVLILKASLTDIDLGLGYFIIYHIILVI